MCLQSYGHLPIFLVDAGGGRGKLDDVGAGGWLVHRDNLVPHTALQHYASRSRYLSTILSVLVQHLTMILGPVVIFGPFAPSAQDYLRVSGGLANVLEPANDVSASGDGVSHTFVNVSLLVNNVAEALVLQCEIDGIGAKQAGILDLLLNLHCLHLEILLFVVELAEAAVVGRGSFRANDRLGHD